MSVTVLLADETGQRVRAELRYGELMKDKLLWYGWFFYMLETMTIRTYYDKHWFNDKDLFDKAINSDDYDLVVIVHDNELQGFIIIQKKNFVDYQGIPASKVVFLAAAPWNRLPNKKYRFVGSLLIVYAVVISKQEGFEGRLELESLPGAETFYEVLGFIDTGLIRDNMKVYTLEPHKGDLLIEKHRELFL